MARSVAIVSAAAFETAPLMTQLLSSNIDVIFVECGIGAIQSAKRCEQTAHAISGRDVFFLGSCGSFSSFEKPYLVTASQVHWLPVDLRLNAAYSIEDIDLPFSLPISLSTDLPKKIVLCSSTIALRDDLPQAYARVDCVENLELYSVAPALVAKAKSFSVILGVTNAIGERAHEQWLQHHKEVSDMLCLYMLKLLHQPKSERS